MATDQALGLFLLMLVAQIPLLIAAIISYLKSKAAIDANTKATVIGTTTATTNARAAATAAAAAAQKTDEIQAQLDGKLEERITAIVERHTKPIVTIIKAHTEQDDKNMTEIRQVLDELRDKASK